ncbi:MAG TPA: phage tail tube protein [Fluviicoccus sp.]|nr:phage tail tube protein [Fluviicoccus sp.]
MSNKLTGRVTITLNGKRYDSKPGASLKLAGVNRNPVITDAGVAGYTEEPTAAECSFTIPHSANVSITEIHAMTEANLVFKTDTGKTYVLENAWCAEMPTLGGGDLPCKFYSATSREA